MGKNGSGKSNFFQAIEFVLGNKYSSLRPTERQKLLHEGTRRDVISASVEIIFDNSDNRFPVERREVSLKRSIGLKKDEYFLNGKHVSKTEVHSLLETAGLSKENPYYIVHQGKVDTLINMSDAKRLELLKEIAGTKTYDERRKDSLRIMNETDAKLQQIDEVIEHVAERLEDLEDEKAELQKYQELDVQRRTLEYAIYDKELKNAIVGLEELDKRRENSSEQTAGLHEKAAQVAEKRAEAVTEQKRLDAELGKTRERLDELKKVRRQLTEKKAGLEIKARERGNKLEVDRAARQAAKQEMNSLSSRIAEKSAEYEELKAEFEQRAGEEAKVKAQLEISEQRIAMLYAKQQRTEQFRSKRERDAFLSKKLKKAQQELSSTKRDMKRAKESSEKLEAQSKAKAESAEKAASELAESRRKIDSLGDAVKKLKADRDAALNQKKGLEAKQNDIKKQSEKRREALHTARRELRSTMDGSVAQALDEARRFARENKIAGYHGPLIELVRCDPRFRKCVETTAGGKLFQVVVDTDRTASRIIAHLRKTKRGRLTFMPLNRIRSSRQEYPAQSSEAIPMIEQLKFEEKFRDAMTQVFGKTLITRDLKTAAKFARQTNLSAITLDGDQVNRMGALTGGFIERRASRLGAQERIEKAQKALDEISERAGGIDGEYETQKQVIAKLTSSIDKSESEKMQLRNACSRARTEIQSSKTESKLAKSKSATDASEASRLEANATQLDAQIASIRDEMSSAFTDQLDADEEKELKELTAKVTQLQQQQVAVAARRAEAETNKFVLENALQTNLRKREEELRGVLDSQVSDEATDAYENEMADLKKITGEVDELNEQVSDAERSVDDIKSRSSRLQSNIEKLTREEGQFRAQLDDDSKNAEKLFSKRRILQERQSACEQKIKDVGTLPSDAYRKHRNKSVKQLMKELEKCNAKLKKFSHVNKKALHQFMNFTSQHEELAGQRKVLDKGRQSILDLIEHLDQKKDEAINRTFKGIAKHFSAVFKKLVKNGSARLTISRKAAGEGSEGKGALTTDKYAGVGVTVSFTGNSQGGGDKALQLFSGGQKAIVALSLIFAIQRCDPSPFYIFDEIDAPLDQVYRRSVADMIREQSSGAQFITTTFHPEFLAAGDKFYGVEAVNNVSTVSVIDSEEARNIIAEIERAP